jgi:peptidoglycan hydrolase-like protein with peptidoglycan-binding domain
MTSRRFALALATVLAGTALSLVPATMASASTPECTKSASHGTNEIVVPVSSSGSSTCDLHYVSGNNEHGDGVLALQEALHYCYGKSISLDGQFGTGTRAALISVQSAIGADPDGGYGPQTHGLMHFSSNLIANRCYSD